MTAWTMWWISLGAALVAFGLFQAISDWRTRRSAAKDSKRWDEQARQSAQEEEQRQAQLYAERTPEERQLAYNRRVFGATSHLPMRESKPERIVGKSRVGTVGYEPSSNAFDWTPAPAFAVDDSQPSHHSHDLHGGGGSFGGGGASGDWGGSDSVSSDSGSSDSGSSSCGGSDGGGGSSD